jgi:hypothetical protein
LEHADDHHAPCKEQLQGVSTPFLCTNGQTTSLRIIAHTRPKCLTWPGAGVVVPGRGLGVETKFECNHKHGHAAAHINSWQPEIASTRALTCSLRSAPPPGPVARRTLRQRAAQEPPKAAPRIDHPTSYPAVAVRVAVPKKLVHRMQGACPV